MSKIFDFLDDYEKKRIKLVHVYVKDFGTLILEKKISVNSVLNFLAEKHGTSRQNIYAMLRKSGVYKNKECPVVPEADKFDEYDQTIDVTL